ncbi:MAG: cell division protein SepF [Armatimonadetes bacterium]|jgi:cell division inhibitor SepF|nr:cell division protein SepF [Armatimonadota bacterium]
MGVLFVRKREVYTREITTCYLRSLKHTPHIADRLKSALPVIVNVAEMPEEERTQALDFISGVAYAIDGSYDQVGDNTFLFVPGSVILLDDD